MSIRAWGVLAVLSLFWGSPFLLIKIALPGFQPLSIVFWRLTLATIVLLIIIRLRGLLLPRGWAVWRLLIILGLIHNALPFTLVAWGQKSVTSALTSILIATVPLWSVAAAPFFLRDENLNSRRLSGIALGFPRCYYHHGRQWAE